jgi:iron complex transport system substrate-binding protein
MRIVILFAAVFTAASAQAQITVRDDAGQTLRLERPAARVVSLSPHLSELLFAAGAGANVVGVLRYSDFPPEARVLPRIGDDATLDLERILALAPDLAVAWPSASHRRQFERLRALGVPVFESEQRELDDIPRALEVLGLLTAHPDSAGRAAQAFRARASDLAHRHSHRPAVRVFFQVWGAPLITVNGAHLISRVLALCGGENVFAELPVLAPQVDTEAVLLANPEVIIASASGASTNGWRAPWLAFPSIPAVRAGNLFEVSSELLERHTPRVLDGAGLVCRDLEAARARRR